MKKTLVLSFMILALCSAARADQPQPQPRLISVTGEGEVLVVPDEVWVNLQVETFDANLSKAKTANDEAIKQVLAIVKKYNVADKDFQTDNFSVRNEERYYPDPQNSGLQRSKKGFFVTKNVAVILRDVTKFEALYSEALEAGINNIYGVEFKTSQLKKYREEARILAAQAAKDKATKIAAELGQEIGPPYTIQENAQFDPYPRPMMMAAMADRAAPTASNETIALGQIKITASLNVSFELK